MKLDERMDQGTILNNIAVLHRQIYEYIKQIDFSNKNEVKEMSEKISEIVYLWLLIKHDIKTLSPD